jgi:membrane protease YdiL (CAAX protease family)
MVSISRRYPVVVAIMINSIVFAMLHLLNSGISFLAFINLILYGILASLYFIKRGNIWGVAAFHSIWNFVQGNFYGIKVSGMDTGTSVFASSTEAGKAIINGGAFGLEGGLGVTIVLVIGIVMIYLMKEKASEYTWEEQHPVDIQEISVQEN